MQPCDILCTEAAGLGEEGGGAEGGGLEDGAILKNRKTKWLPWLHILYKNIRLEYYRVVWKLF